MLRVEGLTVGTLAAPLTFDVGDGRCLGLLGRDASALIALAETIAGMRLPVTGRVLYGNADVFQSDGTRGDISVCLPRACHRLTTVAEHVHTIASSRPTRMAAAEAISRVGANPRARLDTATARSAAALIGALLPDSRVVVLHDPFAHLGETVRNNAIEWIRALSNSETSIVITGTEERDVRAVSHAVIEIGAGR